MSSIHQVKLAVSVWWINRDLSLSIREWTYQNGHVLDRDLNAAKTFLKKD